MGRLSRKVAVVTGGSSGIGKETGRLFVREGAQLVFCARGRENGERAQAEIESAGGEAVFVAADVTNRTDVSKVIETAIDRFGGVDILVNNAQILAQRVPLADKSDDECGRVMRSGLDATRWAMQAVFPSMRARGGGSIVNFSSFAGTVGMKYIADYAAAKEAIAALTRSAAQEWGRYGINVNAIKPAAATQESMKTVSEMIGAAIPLRRMGGAEEVAAAVLGLVSARCRYVTGQTIHADGGQHLMVPRLDLDRGMDLPPVTVAPGQRHD